MFKTYIGQYTYDGIIFHQFINEFNVEEVLIVSLQDLSKDSIWIDSTGYLVGATSKFNGIVNTEIINNDKLHNDSASQLCSNYLEHDWYLPSMFELDLLRKSIWDVNYSLNTLQESEEISIDDSYWTSTEDSPDYAFYYSFMKGVLGLSTDKRSRFRVRAIKRIVLD